VSRLSTSIDARFVSSSGFIGEDHGLSYAARHDVGG
jgi:hypothetical protein